VAERRSVSGLRADPGFLAAENFDGVRGQVGRRGVHVIDVERKVHAAPIAHSRHLPPLAGSVELEDLEVRAVATAHHAAAGHLGPRVKTEVVREPGACGIPEWPQRVEVLAPKHIAKEGDCLIEVGDAERDVLGAP